MQRGLILNRSLRLCVKLFYLSRNIIRMKNFLLLLISFISLNVFGQDGVIDATFGTGGKTYSGYVADFGSQMPVAVQSDGKILQATSNQLSGIYQTILIRYNNNGGLDNTFGNAGKFIATFPSNNAALDMAIQSDGKIVLAGLMDSAGTNYFMAMRITSTGTLDASFGTNGRTIIAFNSQESIGIAMALQADGKIVVGGYASNASATAYVFALARLTTSGALDTSFDTDGKQTTVLGPDFDVISDLAIQADGKIVVAGVSYNSLSVAELAVARYTTAGALDNTFGTGGKFTWSANNQDTQAYSIAMQPDGKIVVSGSWDNNTNFDFIIMRLTAAGALDNSFGTAGKVMTAIGTDDDEAYSVAVQLDGKIVAGGDIYVPSQTGYDIAVVRYTSGGTVDNSFGTAGKAIVDMNSGSDDEYGMIVSQGLKIIVGVLHYDASDNEIPALVRLNNSSTFYNAAACSSPPPAPQITITASSNVLSSNATSNNQWYLNGAAISGATGQTYTATASGIYTATTTVGGCVSAPSNAITYNITGLSFPAFDVKISMAPNPVTSKMLISYKGTDKLYIEVLDLSGRIVFGRQRFTGNRELDFSGYANGTYLVRVINQKTNEKVQRLVIKQ
jgi:uncharacterized delta-60 repeat protein